MDKLYTALAWLCCGLAVKIALFPDWPSVAALVTGTSAGLLLYWLTVRDSQITEMRKKITDVLERFDKESAANTKNFDLLANNITRIDNRTRMMK